MNFIDQRGEYLTLISYALEILGAGKAIHEGSKIIKTFAYEGHLAYEVGRLAYEIEMNCGCSPEEIIECNSRVLDIMDGYNKLHGKNHIKGN